MTTTTMMMMTMTRKVKMMRNRLKIRYTGRPFGPSADYHTRKAFDCGCRYQEQPSTSIEGLTVAYHVHSCL